MQEIHNNKIKCFQTIIIPRGIAKCLNESVEYSLNMKNSWIKKNFFLNDSLLYPISVWS